jgi:hypothetical protein
MSVLLGGAGGIMWKQICFPILVAVVMLVPSETMRVGIPWMMSSSSKIFQLLSLPCEAIQGSLDKVCEVIVVPHPPWTGFVCSSH